MPKSLVEIRRSYSPAEEQHILAAVHAALIAAFRIPEDDRSVRLVEHAPERFTCSPALEQPDRYTLVTIECFAGRSGEAKRRLFAEIAERLGVVGIPRDHISVILHEIDRENWGMDGGSAADADLGFTVEV